MGRWIALGPGLFSTVRQFRCGELLEPLPYDSDQANRLLDEVDWRDLDGDGVRQREGEEFRSGAIVAPQEGKAAVYVQDQLVAWGSGCRSRPWI